MALGRDVVDAIIREHAFRPISGDVLLIGQRALTLSRDEVLELMRKHDVRWPIHLPSPWRCATIQAYCGPADADRRQQPERPLRSLFGPERVLDLDYCVTYGFGDSKVYVLDYPAGQPANAFYLDVDCLLRPAGKTRLRPPTNRRSILILARPRRKRYCWKPRRTVDSRRARIWCALGPNRASSMFAAAIFFMRADYVRVVDPSFVGPAVRVGKTHIASTRGDTDASSMPIAPLWNAKSYFISTISSGSRGSGRLRQDESGGSRFRHSYVRVTVIAANANASCRFTIAIKVENSLRRHRSRRYTIAQSHDLARFLVELRDEMQ